MTTNITTLEDEAVALEAEGMKHITDRLEAIRIAYNKINDEETELKQKKDALKLEARRLFEVEGVNDFVNELGRKVIGQFDSTSVSTNTKAMKVAHPRLYKKYVTEKPIKTFYSKR